MFTHDFIPQASAAAQVARPGVPCRTACARVYGYAAERHRSRHRPEGQFGVVGYTQVLMGEHYCNGVPLSGFSGTTVVFGDPLTNDSLFKLAIANADSALGIVRGSDSARVANFAKVIRGRALLDRGDTAGARAAVVG